MQLSFPVAISRASDADDLMIAVQRGGLCLRVVILTSLLRITHAHHDREIGHKLIVEVDTSHYTGLEMRRMLHCVRCLYHHTGERRQAYAKARDDGEGASRRVLGVRRYGKCQQRQGEEDSFNVITVYCHNCMILLLLCLVIIITEKCQIIVSGARFISKAYIQKKVFRDFTALKHSENIFDLQEISPCCCAYAQDGQE